MQGSDEMTKFGGVLSNFLSEIVLAYGQSSNSEK